MRKEHRNRLGSEKSPYLLQHADNPIDWFPWTEEAFQKARHEDKPVFLSIGYSSCHWCHVMEHESFEDDEVARLMNQHFIAIKVDREERPDIDSIYMVVCQAMTGSGGWPLTVIMTPEKKPFFAGTYFPRRSQSGRPGLIDILTVIDEAWKKEKMSVLQRGDQIAQGIQELLLSTKRGNLTEENLSNAFSIFQQSFDPIYGGFGSAPKFPSAHNLSLILRWWKRSGDAAALAMVEKTLDAMWRGGMYDHLGFGFHRYSTDRQWLIPHFEKMLYDQAMLAIAYTEAYQATGKSHYSRIAQQIFTYVLRDMTSSEGAFYSAEDADSEGEEGKFYTWTHHEIDEILGARKNNFSTLALGEDKWEGKNILHIIKSPEEFAREKEMLPEKLEILLEGSRQKLFDLREKRVHPFKDDKILTDWNGLMIAALARGAQALSKTEYAEAACRAADFILQRMRRQDGRLLHRYRDGEAAIPGYLNDYAFFIWGLIELYETTFEVHYLSEALSLTDEMIELFWDEDQGGFYTSGYDHEKLLTRMKEIYDGAIPSGNSVAAMNLIRLGRMTMKKEFEEKGKQLLDIFGAAISEHPSAFSQFLIALDFALGPTKEIIIAGDLDDEETRKMLDAIRSRFLPGKVLILHPGGEDGKAIEQIIPFIRQQNRIDGKATAYICENHSCKLPTRDVVQIISLLE